MVKAETAQSPRTSYVLRFLLLLLESPRDVEVVALRKRCQVAALQLIMDWPSAADTR